MTENDFGYCGMYRAENGRVVERFPFHFSSIGDSYIEGIPFYHVLPGSRTLVLGSSGCNIDCAYCSNSYVARSKVEDTLRLSYSPEAIIRMAKDADCQSITFPINEPAVILPTVLEMAKEAAKAGIPTGVLTNGLMTESSAYALAEAVDFINVSIKAVSKNSISALLGWYDLDVLFRNISIFNDNSHLELSTPIVQGVNDSDIPAIARFISDLDRSIPWHVFRLLPEYRMSDMDRPNIQRVATAIEKEKKNIDYIYFSNFLGSLWVDTLCPDCGKKVIERINFGGCNAKCVNMDLDSGGCPVCGKNIPIYKNKSISGEYDSAYNMQKSSPVKRSAIINNDIAVIDVIDWQADVEMKTGKLLDIEDSINGNGADKAKKIISEIKSHLKENQYPGDLNGNSCEWITNNALAIDEIYKPDFLFINYCDIFFNTVFSPENDDKIEEIRKKVFNEVRRLIENTDYEPVIVGLGNLCDISGEITLSEIDAHIEAFGMYCQYAGVFSPSEEALKSIESMRGIRKMISRESLENTRGISSDFIERCPDYILCAEEGFYFRGYSTAARPFYKLPSQDESIPVSGIKSSEVKNITDIAPYILNSLEKKKIALIFIEGLGTKDFPYKSMNIGSSQDWFYYPHNNDMYLSILTGEPFTSRPYPPANQAYKYDGYDSPFPYSAYYEYIEPDSIGRRFKGKSASVGGRSVLTHVAAGTDITIECFARALYNHGTIAVMNVDKLKNLD
ncbi:MAG: radical SAM protein [Spirochaetales bacterium]|nr:radical SAM protein [Spirochaetales bacterium]